MFRTELYLSLIYLDIRNLRGLQGGGARVVFMEWNGACQMGRR